MDKFQFLSELCESYGFNCEYKTNGSKQYVIVSKQPQTSFADAVAWENWTNVVIKVFPRATIQTVNMDDKERVAVFYLGDIMEILKG